MLYRSAIQQDLVAGAGAGARAGARKR